MDTNQSSLVFGEVNVGKIESNIVKFPPELQKKALQIQKKQSLNSSQSSGMLLKEFLEEKSSNFISGRTSVHGSSPIRSKKNSLAN